jgi:hypothetical protein
MTLASHVPLTRHLTPHLSYKTLFRTFNFGGFYSFLIFSALFGIFSFGIIPLHRLREGGELKWKKNSQGELEIEEFDLVFITQTISSQGLIDRMTSLFQFPSNSLLFPLSSHLSRSCTIKLFTAVISVSRWARISLQTVLPITYKLLRAHCVYCKHQNNSLCKRKGLRVNFKLNSISLQTF